MQIKIFTLPVGLSERSEDELNQFLRSHRVTQVERHFCPDGGGYWTLCVEYMDGEPGGEASPVSRREREKKDYSKELDEESLKRFEHFKTVRRELATRNSLPAYLIFTDNELATLARVPDLGEDTIGSVKGIAPSRLREYAKFFYIVGNVDGEASGQPDAEDSQSGESV